MAINPRNRRPLRVLAALCVIIIGLYGLLASVHTWGEAQLTPKLGLDLEGGTQLILEPKVVGSRPINQGQIDKAVDIIRQRVDGSGVAEAEVATQGGRNIVISLPGKPAQSTVDSLSKSSQLRFRPVLVQAPNTAPAPAPSATPSATPSRGHPVRRRPPHDPPRRPRPRRRPPSPPARPRPPPGPPSRRRCAPRRPRPPPRPRRPSRGQHARRQTPAASAPATSAPVPAPSPTAPSPTGANGATGTASDLAQITPAIEKQFTALDCKDPKQVEAIVDDPDKVMVTCSVDGTHQVDPRPGRGRGPGRQGRQLRLPELNQQGQPTGGYEIRLSFNSKGAKEFGDVTTRLVGAAAAAEPVRHRPRQPGHLRPAAPTRRSPTARPASPATSPSSSARALADQLKFGALPMSFSLQTQDDISPTLGSEQLQLRPARRPDRPAARGRLLAVPVPRPRPGHRRVPGRRGGRSPTPRSRSWAGRTTSGSTMAGVTGLIVAIGITADSFIVYFERVRDEVREGRPLRAAVETGWNRARRTILVADAVNFLAAAVLYAWPPATSAGSPSPSALTTLIDLARRLPLHPPRRGDPGAYQVLRRGPQVVRPRPRAPRAPTSAGTPAVAGSRSPRSAPRQREDACMSRFAAFGNDLYTGKRSIDFVGRQRLWYAISGGHHRPGR